MLCLDGRPDNSTTNKAQCLDGKYDERMEKWFSGTKLWLFGNQVQLLSKRYIFVKFKARTFS